MDNRLYVLKTDNPDHQKEIYDLVLPAYGWADPVNALQKTAAGKPYDSLGRIELNKADCRSACILALSDLPVGIDIEERRPIRNATILRLPVKEQRYIEESKDKELAFLKLWTLRESYVKMTGEGLSKAAFSVSFADAVSALDRDRDGVYKAADDAGCYYMRMQSLDGYIIAVSARSAAPFEIVFC